MAEFRATVSKTCLLLNRNYTVRDSRPAMFIATCRSVIVLEDKSDACPFRISAYKHTDGLIHVNHAILEHSPFCQDAVRSSSSISALATVARPFKSCIQEFTPRDLQTVRGDFGVEVPYSTAWKALNSLTRADEMINGENTFYRAFFCPGFASNILEDCLPVVVTDVVDPPLHPNQDG